MAASLSDLRVPHKRKLNELEDITNNDLFHSKKGKMNFKGICFKGAKAQNPQQQRSPSPSDMSSSPSRPRNKSVSFELAQEKQYEESPLLTPKDEEDEDEKIGEQEGVGGAGVENVNGPADLSTNVDYIALSSSLRLLRNNKNKIELEIVLLSQTLRHHAELSTKNEIVEFFLKLMDNDLNLPKINKILKSPTIDWSKYHTALRDVGKGSIEGTASDTCVFKTLNLFGSR